MSYIGNLGLLGEVFFTIFVCSTSSKGMDLTHILQIIKTFKHLNGKCSPFKELISSNNPFHLLKVNWSRDNIINNWKDTTIKSVSSYTYFFYSLVFYVIVVLLNTNDLHCRSRRKLLLTYKQKTAFKKICADIIFSTNNHSSSNSLSTCVLYLLSWNHHSSKCSGHNIYEAEDIFFFNFSRDLTLVR